MLRITLFLFAFLPAAFASEPGNFHRVGPGFYRSAQPTGDDLATLQREYGLKTVVSLSDDEDDLAWEAAEAKRLGIKFYARPLSGFFAPTDGDIANILELLRDSMNQPVLVHCMYGEDRTGLVVGLYRVYLERWRPSAAYEEMLSLGFKPYLLPLDMYFHDKTR